MTPAEALTKLTIHTHAVVIARGADGYPVQVATSFQVTATGLELQPADAGLPVGDGPAQVVFSHIRPRPGVGYDKRAYVQLDGTLQAGEAVWRFDATRARGWDEHTIPFVELCERAVPQGRRYLAQLSAEQGRSVEARLGIGWRLFLATRAPFLTATLVPIGLGAAAAAFDGAFNWALLLATLLGGLAAHLGLNVANDIFDTRSGADDANVTPTMFSGGSRVLQYGLMSMRQMWAICLTCYAVAIAVGVGLVVLRGPGLLWLGAAGILISYFYTAPPLKLVHRGLGEVAVAVGFGPIMVMGAFFVQTQHYTWRPLLLSLPVAIMVMLILYANEIPDRHSDAMVGKRTLVVRLPKSTVLAVYLVSATIAYLAIVVGAATRVLPLTALLGMLTLPLALRVLRTLDRAYDRPYELMAGLQDQVLLHLGTGVLLIGGTLAGHLTG